MFPRPSNPNYPAYCNDFLSLGRWLFLPSKHHFPAVTTGIPNMGWGVVYISHFIRSHSVSNQLKFNVSAFPYKIFFCSTVEPPADFSKLTSCLHSAPASVTHDNSCKRFHPKEICAKKLMLTVPTPLSPNQSLPR